LDAKNILLLTSRTGGGHVSIAESLRDLITEDAARQEDMPAPALSIIDPQPRFFHLHYRLVSRYALGLWAAEFQFFDTPGRARLAHRVFTRLVNRQLHTLLDRVKPELIITTYPFLSYEVMRVLQQRQQRIPLALFFSDANGVHAAWLSEQRAAASFAPTRETYEQALAAGFAPERLHLVGWPVRAQFFQSHGMSPAARREQLARLQLVPDRFTIFLQGGGEGAAHVARTIEHILGSTDFINEIQVILATGTNRALQERYQNTPNLAVLPFTREIAPVMAAADIVMGKAGPNMLFETVTLGKPFIATAYIPGQEEANLAFIQRHGLGWVAIKPEEQRALLDMCLHRPGELATIQASLETQRQANNAGVQKIVPLLRALPQNGILKGATPAISISSDRNDHRAL
jgi:UDP-N-acetylglucosamine:LPS N-acetylglucosamine transferase